MAEKRSFGKTALNLGKDITAGMFSTVMPVTSNTIRDIYGNSVELLKANRKISRRNERDLNTRINNSKSARDAGALWEKANADMSSGSFNIGKINNELYANFDDEIDQSFNLNSLTADQKANMSSDDISLRGMEGVAKSVVRSTSAQMETSIRLNEALIKSNLKSNQAMIKSINSTIIGTANSITTQLMITNNRLDAINKNLVSLIEFQNKNALNFYQTSLKMMQAMSKQFDEYSKSNRGPGARNLGNFDTTNGFNIREYIKYVKGNFNKTVMGSGLGMAKAARAMSSGRPGEMIGTMLFPLLFGSSKTAGFMSKMDSWIGLAMDEGLKQFRDFFNKKAGTGGILGLLGSLGIGDIFGNKRRGLGAPNMGMYAKDPMPWNGKAQKALTEVIPELLTSIDAGINGTQKRYYDYKAGTWKDLKQINKEFDDRRMDILATQLDNFSNAINRWMDNTHIVGDDKRKANEELSAIMMARSLDPNGDPAQYRKQLAELCEAMHMSTTDFNKFFLESEKANRQIRQELESLQREIERTDSVFRNSFNGANGNGQRSWEAANQRIRGNQVITSRGGGFSADVQSAIDRIDATLSADPDLGFKMTANYKAMVRNGLRSGKSEVEILDDIVTHYRRVSGSRVVGAKVQQRLRQHAVDRGHIRQVQKTSGFFRRKPVVDEHGNPIMEERTPLYYKAGKFIIDTVAGGAPVDIDPIDAFLANETGVLGGIESAVSGANLKVYGVNYNMGNGPGQRQRSYWDCGPTAYANIFGSDANKVRSAALRSGYSSRKGGTSSALFYNAGGVPFGYGGLRNAMRSGRSVVSVRNQRYPNGHIYASPGVNKYGKPMIYDRHGNLTTTTFGYLERGFNGGFGFGPGAASSQRSEMNGQNAGARAEANRFIEGYAKQFAKDKAKPLGETATDIKIQSGLREGTPEVLEQLGSSDPEKSSVLTMASIVSGFNNFTNKLVGEEGLMQKFFSGELVDTLGESIKKALFDEEEGVFGEQVKQAKAWGKDVWSRTKGQLSKGYNWIYDQYNIGKYGENYKESEEWKNSSLAQYFNPDEEVRKKRKELRKYRGKTSEEIVMDLAKERGMTSKELVEAISKDKDLKKELINRIDLGHEANDNSKDNPFLNATRTMWDIAKQKNLLPKALAAGIAGSAIGGLNLAGGSSLVGMMLPGGPIAGAIAGIGLMLLSQTKTFQEVMFGKDITDDQGNITHAEGLISKNLQDSFKKALPTIVKGAVVGGAGALVKGAIGMGGGGLGVLGMQLLPGGVLGGAILGAGIGLLKNNEAFMNRIFGEKGDDGKRSGSWLSNTWNKFSEKLKNAEGLDLKGKANKTLKGGALGVLTGAALSHMGVLPAMFSLGGPVGMGIAGLSIGLASTTEKFNTWLFGEEILDKDGKKTGKRTTGFLGRVRNMFVVDIWDPLVDTFRKNMVNTMDWIKKAIVTPFHMALGPIIDSFRQIKDDISEVIKNAIDKISNGVRSMIEGVVNKIFTPITNVIGKVFKGIMGAAGFGAKLALSPLAVIANGAAMLTSGKRGAEIREAKRGFRRGIGDRLEADWAERRDAGEDIGFFKRQAEFMDAFFGFRGSAANKYVHSDEYREMLEKEGKVSNSLGWLDQWTLGKKQDKEKRQNFRGAERQWNKVLTQSQKFSKKYGGRRVTLTDDEFQKVRERFITAGIDPRFIQNNDDLMQLIYDKDAFLKRTGGDSSQFGFMNALKKYRKENSPEEEVKNEVHKFHESVDKKLDTLIGTMSNEDGSSTADAVTAIANEFGISNKDIKAAGEGKELSAENLSKTARRGIFGIFDRIKEKRAANAARDEREKAESEAATSGKSSFWEDFKERWNSPAGAAVDKIKPDEKKEKKPGLLSKLAKGASNILGGIFNAVGGVLGGSTVGRVIKTGGIIWLASSAVLGIMEMIKPGTQAKLMGWVEKTTDQIGNHDFKKDFLDPLLEKIGAKITTVAGWISEHVPVFITDYLVPAIVNNLKTVVKVGGAVIGAAKDVVIALAPALANAFIEVVPKVAGSFAAALYNATIAKWFNWKTINFGGSNDSEVTGAFMKTDDQGNLYLDEAEVRRATAELEQNGKTTIIDENGNTRTIVGKNLHVDENGKITYTRTNTGSVSKIATDVSGAALRNAALTAAGIRGAGAAANVAGGIVGGIAGGSLGGAVGSVVPGVGTISVGAAGAKVGAKAGSNVTSRVNSGIATFISDIFQDTSMFKHYVTKEAGEAVVDAGIASTKKKWLTKFFDKCNQWVDDLSKNAGVKKILGKICGDESIIGKAFAGIKKGLKWVADRVFADQRLWMKYANKVSEAFAKMGMDVTPAAVLLGTYALANGAFTAPSMFHVMDSDCDWLMRLISAIFELGLAFAPLLDIVIEMGGAVLGKDFKCWAATKLYCLIAPDDGGLGLIGDDKLLRAQEIAEIATSKYNEAHDSNVTVKELMKKANPSIAGWIWNGVKAASNWAFDTDYDTVGKVRQELESYGISEADIKAYSSGMTGTGPGRRRLGRGPERYERIDNSNPHSQGYWGPTMAATGCGPTAFANAISNLSGVAPSPAAIAAIGSKVGGYNPKTGTDSRLFTGGIAESFGYKSTYVPRMNLIDSLKSGGSTVVSYKRSDGSDHIVTLNGLDGSGRTNFTDSQNGKPVKVSARELANSRINAAYNIRRMGTGPNYDTAYEYMMNSASNYGTTPDLSSVKLTPTTTTSRTTTQVASRAASTTWGDLWNAFKNAESGDPYTASWSNPETFGITTTASQTRVAADATDKDTTQPTLPDWIKLTDSAKRGRSENNGDWQKLAESIVPQGTIARGVSNGDSYKKIYTDYIYQMATRGRSDDNEYWRRLAAVDSMTYSKSDTETRTWKEIYQGHNPEIVINSLLEEQAAKVGDENAAAAAEAFEVINPWDRERVFADIGSGQTIFQKLAKFAKLLQAIPKSIINGTSIWEEYGKLTGSDTTTTASRTGSSSALVNFDPNDVTAGIWDTLIAAGVTPQAAAGIMGNLKQESMLVPTCVEGWYDNEGLRKGREYTAEIDANKVSKEAFAKSPGKPSGAGGKGYGLVQWTSADRKRSLYDASKSNKVSIGDPGFQTDFMLSEMASRKNGKTGKTDFESIVNETDIARASNYIFENYEAPGDDTGPKRIDYSKAIYEAYKNRKINLKSMDSNTDMGTGPRRNGRYGRSLLWGTTMGMGPSLTEAIANTSAAYQDFKRAMGVTDTATGTSSDTGSYAYSGSAGTYTDVPAWNGVASTGQKAVVNNMRSIIGKIKYSLGDTQDPDKGIASCASTVGWAYRKALGVKGMSASSTEQSKDSRFQTIWTNDGSNSFPIAKLQPGDILYQNWSNTRNNGAMNHTEMYQSDGIDLSHGGNPEYGPVEKTLNDYRRKHTMMIRRYKGFMGNLGTGPSKAHLQSLSANSMNKNFSSRDIMREVDHEFKPSSDYLGFGPASMDGTENKLEKILAIIAQWYDESRGNKNQQVAIYNQNNNINAAQKEASKPAAQVDSKIKQLQRKFQMVASV